MQPLFPFVHAHMYNVLVKYAVFEHAISILCLAKTNFQQRFDAPAKSVIIAGLRV